MSLLKNPLPLPLSLIGVTPEDFLRPSPAHGPAHTNRVIYLALTIARTMGYSELMPAIWAAAHLHDLARTHDGQCTIHGERAVQFCLPRLLGLYRKGGVNNNLLAHVAGAVSTHCTAEALPREHLFGKVASVLRDADALDRVRFGGFDPKYLQIPNSIRYLRLAQYLFARTGHGPSVTFEQVWDAGLEFIRGPLEVIARVPDNGFDEAETPVIRRNRRLRQAVDFRKSFTCGNTVHGVNLDFWDPSKPAIPAFRDILGDIGANPNLLEWIRLVDAPFTATAKEMVPVTCTHKASEFLADGVYRSFWEAGPSWHYRYNDDPVAARTYFEGVLFGEKARYLAYGILVNPNAVDTLLPLDLCLRNGYGRDVLVWDRGTLEGASFCVNDSGECHIPCMVPFSPCNWVKCMALTALLRDKIEIPETLYPWAPQLNFFEVQIHAKLTTNDLARAEDVPLLAARPGFITRRESQPKLALCA